jgi:small neutral amino acid transporter SnatA (MarC family)
LWDFIVKLLKLKDLVIGQEYNSILVIVDKFTKWGYFILYSKSITSEKLLRIYIKEVFIRHKILTKIIFNRDRKFILKFWETFTAK